jgi:hypothetical protein
MAGEAGGIAAANMNHEVIMTPVETECIWIFIKATRK